MYYVYMLHFIKEAGHKTVPSGNRRRIGLYKCSCGNTKEITISNVTRGITKSCGCITKEQIRKLGIKTGKEKGSYRHGMFGTRFYGIFSNLRDRTTNKNSSNARFYYDMGIRCEWDTFREFYNDMYTSYCEHVKKYGERDTTINRTDPSKNYSKENCTWATRLEQGGNRKNNLLITINGETNRLAEWVRILGKSKREIKKQFVQKISPKGY